MWKEWLFSLPYFFVSTYSGSKMISCEDCCCIVPSVHYYPKLEALSIVMKGKGMSQWNALWFFQEDHNGRIWKPLCLNLPSFHTIFFLDNHTFVTVLWRSMTSCFSCLMWTILEWCRYWFHKFLSLAVLYLASVCCRLYKFSFELSISSSPQPFNKLYKSWTLVNFAPSPIRLLERGYRSFQ